MCCFSGPVEAVSTTKIFARAGHQAQQFLIYAMQYQAESELAMILPLPTPPSPAEDAVHFLDLSAYPDIFADMERSFPVMRSRAAFGSPQAKAPLLIVHSVGSFEASFVPTRQDFARLDDRFRLPDGVWDDLPTYAEYSFAVFKLKSGAHSVHPMAFSFPRRNPDALFFPTVHIHQGVVEEKADFDHTLYWQSRPEATTGGRGSSPRWRGQEQSIGPAGNFVRTADDHGIVDPDRPLFRQRVHGLYANEDIFLPEES
jgi:hypothetical protein